MKDLSQKSFYPRAEFPIFYCALPIFFMILSLVSCSPRPQDSLLTRELVDPLVPIQEGLSKGGRSDHFLFSDEGSSLRFVYLCGGKVFNFLEEAACNPVLVSIQPPMASPVEFRLPPDERRKIRACMEIRVWEEEDSAVQERKTRTEDERKEIEKELGKAERERLLAQAIENRNTEAEDAERQLRIAQEKRRQEEDRLRKVAEEQRKVEEEDRKLRYYKAGEKEGVPAPPQVPLPVRDAGVFLVMKECDVHKDPRISSKTILRAEKYHLFEVTNSKRDPAGNQWHQVIVSEKVVAEKGRRFGWSPEEKAYWARNKLLVWVYPIDILKRNNNNNINIKALRLKPDEVQFTGKTSLNSRKQLFYEVSYLVNTSFHERVIGWVNEKDGIHRDTKTIEDMRALLDELSKTSWPIAVQEDILKGNIRQGFSREQVTLSWGQPDHVNSTRTLMGLHEQWVYGEAPFPNSYVYFENGIVNNWEFYKNGK